MTTGRFGSRLVLAFGCALLFTASAAHATDPCIDDAKQTFTDCKGDCKEGFQTAKDACLQRDHDCVEGCRAGRADCIIESGLPAALDQCRDDLRNAKTTCRNDPNNPAGSDNLDKCIDQAQVVAFLCRKAARTAAKPKITACRVGFRACAKACPSTGGDVIDKIQCKVDAKNAYLACKAACREDFQSQKDLCNGHNHDCVEVCRANRDTCRQPFEDQLDAALTVCKSNRDTAVNNCKAAYGEGTQALQDCLTQAYVAAFQCRDQAREDVAGGFAGCRQQFQDCAEACPAS